MNGTLQYSTYWIKSISVTQLSDSKIVMSFKRVKKSHCPRGKKIIKAVHALRVYYNLCLRIYVCYDQYSFLFTCLVFFVLGSSQSTNISCPNSS